MVRKYPYEERGVEPDRAWIPVMFVHPEYRRKGIGRQLVTTLEEKFNALGKSNITLGAYSPNYFFPGPDKDVYGESILFFESLGYQVLGEAVGMDMVLYNFSIPDKIKKIKNKLYEEDHIKIIRFKKEYSLPLLQFLKENFPGAGLEMLVKHLKSKKGKRGFFLP